MDADGLRGKKNRMQGKYYDFFVLFNAFENATNGAFNIHRGR